MLEKDNSCCVIITIQTGAICKKDPDIGHGNEMSITIGITSAVICVLGLCIIPICIKKYFAGNALQFI